MGAGNSAPPLLPNAFAPLETYAAIASDDSYWLALLSRRIVPVNIMALCQTLVKAATSNADNVRELLHVSIVRLIDIVHRLELSQPPPDAINFHTLLFLISASCVALTASPHFAGALACAYDDCGVLGSAAANTLVKSLFLANATVAAGQPLWCDRPADNGLFDQNRSSLVLALLLFRWFGCEFLDFPRSTFESSIGNALLTFHSGRSRLRSVPDRLDVIHLSLLLMLCLESDFSFVGASEEAVFFRPLTVRLDRRHGELEARTYIIPFFVHFLCLKEPRFTALANATMLENALHMCDFVRSTEFSPVMLRVLAGLVSLPELARVLADECRAYACPDPTHLGPWITVVLQVAARVAASWAGGDNDAVLAALLAKLMPETDALPVSTLRQILGIYAGTKDRRAFVSFGWTIRKLIGRGSHVRTLAAVLSAPEFLQRLLEMHGEDEKVRDVLVWAKAQTEKCRSIKEQFTLEDLQGIIADSENRVQPQWEIAEEPVGGYDIRGEAKALGWVLTVEYLKDTARIDLGRLPQRE